MARIGQNTTLSSPVQYAKTPPLRNRPKSPLFRPRWNISNQHKILTLNALSYKLLCRTLCLILHSLSHWGNGSPNGSPSCSQNEYWSNPWVESPYYSTVHCTIQSTVYPSVQLPIHTAGKSTNYSRIYLRNEPAS